MKNLLILFSMICRIHYFRTDNPEGHITNTNGCNVLKLSVIHSLMLLLLVSTTGQAFTVRTDTLDLSCLKNDGAGKLQCGYWLSAPDPVTDISVAADNKPVAVEQTETYPWDGAVTAILILVDTSDPGRENVIMENRKIIELILGQAGAHDLIGLATFDNTLRQEAPVGAAHEEILAAAGTMRALGMTTELYRSVLSAIDVLKKTRAERKSIYLMSDGLAEDKAYFHQDVVRAARAAGVVITSLGYPRSVSQSVGLQILRRLSDETGGIYVESDSNFHLPDEFLRNPFSSIDNGGRFTIDVTELIQTPAQDRNIITVDIKTNAGNNHVDIPLNVLMPRHDVKESEQKPAVAVSQPSPTPTAPVTIITREAPAEPDYFWSWYLVLVGLVFLLIIVITAFFLMVYRQGRKKTGSATYTAVPSENKPYAYLILQDESKKRYPILKTSWRIGRGSDNEMVLQDNSVSRRHAEIHRDKGDVFTLYDLDSLNGVFVNDNKVTKQVLHEGDIIEIGDIVLRFSLLSDEYQMEESTIMQHTRTPLAH